MKQFLNTNSSLILFTKIARFITILLLVYIFLILLMGTLSFKPQIEHDFYMNYAQSIVENHDLNILNKISPSAAWIVSTTFNYPEMHDYGASLIWSPFYYLARLTGIKAFVVAPINLQLPADYIITFMICALFAIFSFGCLIKWYNSYNERKLNLYSIFAVLFGTGLFNYLFIQYNGTEVIIFSFAAIMLTYASLIDREFSFIDFLCLGIFFGFGRLIKIHFVTYFIPVFFYFILNYSKVTLRKKMIAVLAFACGLLPLLMANEYNNFLKFGFVNLGQGYLEEFSLKSFLAHQNIFESYLGPCGLFYQMPIFFFTFLIFLYLIFEWVARPNQLKLSEKIGIMVYLSIVVKMVLFTFVPTPSQNEFGGRNYMIDTGAHLLMLNALMDRLSTHRRLLIAFKILLFSAISWTILTFFWYYEMVDLIPDQRLIRYIDEPSRIFHIVRIYTTNLITATYHLSVSFKQNLTYVPWLALPALLIYNYQKVVLLLMNKKTLRYVSFYLFLLMMFVTGMNHFNNHSNAEQLRLSGRFDKIVIGNGIHIFTYDNFMTDIIAAMETDKYNRKKEKYEYKLATLRAFLAKAKAEVISDNIGFTEQIDNGLLPKIGVLDDDSANAVLFYDGPTRTTR